MADATPRTKRWQSPDAVDQTLLNTLATKTTLPLLICRLLIQRGVTDIETARRFLKPKVEHLHDPFLMKGVRELVQRLLAAKERGARIGIHGDYDVDGLTSTTLYTLVLRKLGFDVTPFVPHRMIDGYGVSTRALQQFVDDGISVVLTCDTGFSAVDEVRTAIETHGLEVLITDHHHPPEVLPKAHAMVNPHQKGCEYPFKELCGAGVAFKVLQALVREMGLDEVEVLHPHLDLVALGTVADVVPLRDENRVLVKLGIKALRDSQNLGLRTLFEVAQLPIGQANEGTFGYRIGPRLNATGRIDDAGRGLRLLISQDPDEALQLAQEIEQLNRQRQKLSAAIEKSAIAKIEAMNLEDIYGLALFGNAAKGRPDPAQPTPGTTNGDPADEDLDPETVEWHHGVIGIVASRIVERYGRPAFLFALDEGSGKWKGSGRAPKVGDVHLYDALAECVDHVHKAPDGTPKFGGHQCAAGATLAAKTPKQLEAFAKAFNAAMRKRMAPEDRIPLLRADLEVRLDDLTDDLYRMLTWFAPFGAENESINLIARDVEVVHVKVAKEVHLILRVRQGSQEFKAVLWNAATQFPEIAAFDSGTRANLAQPFTADLFFQIEENVWQGKMSLELKLKDFRPSETALADGRRRAEQKAAAAAEAEAGAQTPAPDGPPPHDDADNPFGGVPVARDPRRPREVTAPPRPVAPRTPRTPAGNTGGSAAPTSRNPRTTPKNLFT